MPGMGAERLDHLGIMAAVCLGIGLATLLAAHTRNLLLAMVVVVVGVALVWALRRALGN